MSTLGLELVGVARAAALIGVTPGRIRQMLRAGDLKGEKLSERAWAIPVWEIDRVKSIPQLTGRPRISA